MRRLQVYLAAPWAHKHEAQRVVWWLKRHEISITSRWLDFVGDSTDPVVLRREATRDWEDLSRSDVLVLLNMALSEGKAVEQGLALAWGKPIIGMPGPAHNIFHHLPAPAYTWVPTIDEVLKILRRHQETLDRGEVLVSWPTSFSSVVRIRDTG